MNWFDSVKAARCGQRPIAVDMGPMASTYNSTLVRNTHFRSRRVARAIRLWVRNSKIYFLDLAERNVLLVGAPWPKHTRISRSKSKYSGCYECVWLGNDIHLNNDCLKWL